ncbi:retromer complex subunit Vps35 [Leucoagaricus gongylophorus]
MSRTWHMISTCKLEEDSISESHAITGSLAGAKAFGADNYDTLTTKAALHDAVKPPPKEGEEEAKSVASSTKTVKVYWNASRNPFAQRIRQLKK